MYSVDPGESFHTIVGDAVEIVALLFFPVFVSGQFEGAGFHTSILLQKLASIQAITSPKEVRPLCVYRSLVSI